ncbi:major facilitator superfamily domain-containing protein [Mrakia frigida]|uniref:MFS transporter n=1 Tax=Mrakia frigida TaxID=29902 RepID=UPI003FCC1778
MERTSLDITSNPTDPQTTPTRSPSPSPTLTADLSTLPLSSPKKIEDEQFLSGTGSEEDPYEVGWAENDSADPYTWKKSFKWFVTGVVALDTLCIAFASSAYSGGVNQIAEALNVKSQEIMILGISLYVLGFGAGPLIWAPLSEIYGRRIIFIVSYAPFTLFQIGGATANNIETVIITRFLAGFFGSAPLTNSGGIIADIWSAQERGLATALFALAPFLGPVLGPIIGGFTAPSGWRNVFWVMFAFAAVTYILTFFTIPETYAPTLLRAKARRLEKESEGSVHFISKFDKANTMTTKEIFKLNMTRPFVLLFKEPIVLLLSIYIAIVYGTLYMFFTAFPIVFQEGRGWSTGVGGLAFLGLAGGMILATALAPLNNKLYMRAIARSPTGRAPPEARLYFAMLGAPMLPIGLFWYVPSFPLVFRGQCSSLPSPALLRLRFAWTSNPSIHWISPVLAGAPFGFGMLLVFTSVLGYLIDTYLMYAASALAANAVLRSILGAVFPLFSTYMYKNLGNEWASSLIGFLALICVPMPFVFFYYGERIRGLSSFSPTGKPAPLASSLASSPTDAEKSDSTHPHRLQPMQSRPEHRVDELGQEFGEEAGMEEQRAQDLEFERRRSGINVV